MHELALSTDRNARYRLAEQLPNTVVPVAGPERRAERRKSVGVGDVGVTKERVPVGFAELWLSSRIARRLIAVRIERCVAIGNSRPDVAGVRIPLSREDAVAIWLAVPTGHNARERDRRVRDEDPAAAQMFDQRRENVSWVAEPSISPPAGNRERGRAAQVGQSLDGSVPGEVLVFDI